jgi:hypothetical protein
LASEESRDNSESKQLMEISFLWEGPDKRVAYEISIELCRVWIREVHNFCEAADRRSTQKMLRFLALEIGQPQICLLFLSAEEIIRTKRVSQKEHRFQLPRVLLE